MADEASPSSPTPETPPPRTTGGNWRWEPPSAEDLQALMPGYTIEKILGRGGMGAVYRGVQTNLDRPVAIKILPPGVEKEDPSFAERFKSEAKLMAKLMHPGVVAVFDFGTTLGGQLYFAMEYVDGSDVSQMIAAQGKLPPEHALAITAHVCDALSAAHELGIVHRDIKPANVLLNMKGQVKVADFGLAKVEEPGSHGLTKTGYAMGTPDFVAPEALTLGTAIDGRADLYAVGVMLYQMLTGNIPRGAFKPASVLVPGLDPRFDPIILKAMQHDREERHQDAMELRRELDVILTVPFVRNDAPVSAAIPVAKVAEAPGQRSAAQRPAGKAPQPDGRGVRQNAAPANTPNRTLASAPTAKSKTPLLIGLGVAAAIGIGAFVMFSGGKKPEPKWSAQSSVRSDESPPVSKPAQGTVRTTLSAPAPPKPVPATPSAPVSKSPALSAAKSSDQFPPGKWVKVFTKPEDLPEELREGDRGLRFENGWIQAKEATPSTKLPIPGLPMFNAAVRVRMRSLGKGTGLLLVRDQGGEPDGTHRLNLQTNVVSGFTTSTLQLRDRGRLSTGWITITSTPAPKASGEGVVLELATLGNRVIARADDRLLGTSTDSRSEKGLGTLSLQQVAVRDIEVINLDGLSVAEALKILGVDEKGNDLRQKPATVTSATPAASSPTPSAAKASTAPASSSPPLPVSKSSDPKFPLGQWVKMFSKPEDLPEGWSLENERLVPSETKPVSLSLTKGAVRNFAARLRVFVTTNAGQTHIRLRRKTGLYTFALTKSGSTILGHQTSANSGEYTLIGKQWSGRQLLPGSDVDLEFATVGSRLITRLNGLLIDSSSDERLQEGFGTIFNEANKLSDIEVINLDGLSEAEALRILGVDEKGNDLRALAAQQEQQKAEMAQQTDAMAAIPELKALHEQFVKLQGERVTAPFEAEVAKLNAGYVGGIDREIANEKKAGHLDGVIALEAEKKLIVASSGTRSQGADGLQLPIEATAMPIPAEDDATTTDALKKLRGIYREAYAKLEATRAANLKALTDPLATRLQQIEAALTQQDRIDHAKTVREYREGLGRAAGPPAAASDSAAQAGSPPSTALGGPSALPAAKYPKGDDRKAAEWALDLGGTVRLRDGRNTKTISKKDDLPRSSFELQGINIKSNGAASATIPFTGLAPMAGLRSLENFETNAIPVTDDDTEILASLPNLRVLTISYSKQFTGSSVSMLKDCAQLQSVNFGSSGLRKQGIEQLGQLNGLTSVSISSNELTDGDVAPLRNLKKLTKLHLGRNPLGLEAWRQLKGLPLTSIQYTPEPGRAKEWTKELASLFPAITQSMMVIQEGAVPTVEDIEAQAAFPLLKELGVTSSATDDQVLEAISHMSNLHNLEFTTGAAPNPLPITDEGIAHLLNLKSLNRLVLRRTENLTPAALTTLARIKSLKTLELAECPQLDEAAVAAFKKARPDVTVKR